MRPSLPHRLVRPLLLPLLVLVSSLAAPPARAVLQFEPSGFTSELVAGGLPFATGIAWSPDGRLFIALKSGVVRVWQNGSLLPAPFVDLSAQVNDHVDRGLLGIAIHPSFPSTPYVYLLFAYDPPGVAADVTGARLSRLVRVTADAAQGHNVAVAGSEIPQVGGSGPGHVVLAGTNSTLANIGNPNNGRDQTKASCMTGLTMAGTPVHDCLPADEDSHSIGTVAFGTDGSLFFSTGDASDYTDVDPRAFRALQLDSLAGKILRIDPSTGLGLPDNPFFQSANPGSNRSKVWSYGLRNPFRFTIHPTTNQPYVGDVGWNTEEEINTGKGKNFGWPCYEGGVVYGNGPESGITTSKKQSAYRLVPSTAPTCNALYDQGLGVVQAPVWAYDHDGVDGYGETGGASANAGAFYTGTVYPPPWQNALFILDYNRRWLRALTFDAQGVATIQNFAKESTSDGMVQALVGPDSNLYVVIYRSSGSEIRRIRYTVGGNTPPTAVAAGTPTNGATPLNVSFSSLGSFDPDSQPISYAWTFGDGGTSSSPNPSHVYNGAGVYTATLTVTELTAPFASGTAQVVITVGHTPPLATITTPLPGAEYQVGETIPYAGFATEGGLPVDPSQLSWELRLHHNQHIHYDGLGTGAGGSLYVEEHGDQTFLELCLTATVAGSLTDVRCVALTPRRTQVTVTSDPTGLDVTYQDEGLELPTPAILNPIRGSVQTIIVDPIQQGRTFVQWSDGLTSNLRSFTVGTTPLSFQANFTNLPPVAAAQATPLGGAQYATVMFASAGSSDPEGTALSYDWDFGDAQSSTSPSPTHVYGAQGLWPVTLTVTDALGGEGVANLSVLVSDGDLDDDGVADGGDNCVSVANPGQQNGDGDALGDLCDPACGPVPLVLTGVGAPPAPSGVQVQVLGSGFSPTTQVWLNGAPGETIHGENMLFVRVPSAPIGTQYAVSLRDPAGCTSPNTVTLTVTDLPGGCGLLGIEAALVLLPALLARTRRGRA